MALKVHFDKRASMEEHNRIIAQAKYDIIQAMKYAGEMFVREARNMTKDAGGFGDITGNLRSSIAYFIIDNGEIINDDMKGSTTGQLAAKMVLAEVDKQGLLLVGVAGMNYASHVEARGFNVISMQADAAIVDLSSFFKEIERKYNR